MCAEKPVRKVTGRARLGLLIVFTRMHLLRMKTRNGQRLGLLTNTKLRYLCPCFPGISIFHLYSEIDSLLCVIINEEEHDK